MKITVTIFFALVSCCLIVTIAQPAAVDSAPVELTPTISAFHELLSDISVIRKRFLDKKQLPLLNLAPSRELDRIPWQETVISLPPEVTKEKATTKTPDTSAEASSNDKS